MRDATFTTPDLTTFTRLDELGLVVMGQQSLPKRPRSWTPSTSSGWPRMPWTCVGAGSSSTFTVIAAARATRSTRRDEPFTLVPTCTDKQAARLRDLFVSDNHVAVEATWGIYQRMVAAYREPDRRRGRELMANLIDSISTGVPAGLEEIITLGRTLKKRAADVPAYFDKPRTSNGGPTEAINGRLEHLRGSALGFRNLTDYVARSLLESGGFRPRLDPRIAKSPISLTPRVGGLGDSDTWKTHRLEELREKLPGTLWELDSNPRCRCGTSRCRCSASRVSGQDCQVKWLISSGSDESRNGRFVNICTGAIVAVAQSM